MGKQIERLIEKHGEKMELLSFEQLIEEMCGVPFDEVYPNTEDENEQGNME